MKKLFNQEYLEMLINSENFEQSQNKLERVILSMDIFGENFREDIAFIFNKINKNLIEPILRSISHNIKNIEFVRLLHSTREE